MRPASKFFEAGRISFVEYDRLYKASQKHYTKNNYSYIKIAI